MAPQELETPRGPTQGGKSLSTESLAQPAHRPTTQEVHHAAPRCLLRLYDEAANGDLDGEGIQAWLEFEHEALRWGVDVEISREDLQALIERSTVVLERE